MFTFHRETSRGWVRNSAEQNNNFYYAGVMPYDDGHSWISTSLIVHHNASSTPHSAPGPLANQCGTNCNWPLDYNQTNNSDLSGTWDGSWEFMQQNDREQALS